LSLLLHGSPWVVIGSDTYLRDASIYIDGDSIAAVGATSELESRYADAERVDCSDLLLMPGFLNCHNHVYEILCRGLGKDAGTEGWLLRTIYPMNRVLTEEDFYHGGLLGAADCFRTGTTGIVSQLTNFARFHADAETRAFRDVGIRARVARASSTASTIDPEENGSPDEEVEATAAFLDRWSGHERVSPAVGPSGLFSCDPETHYRLKQLANEKGSKYFTHLNETREQLDLAHSRGFPGQIDWAYRIGILDADTVVAHAVWSNEAEFDILARTGAMVVHNPISNMVMSSGVANIPAMLRAGVHVSVATDGPASNDSLDMLAEMKAALLLHRVATLDPTIIDPQTVFGMATEAGARVFGMEGRIGRLEPGSLADVVGLRVGGNPSMQPVFDPVAALVYYGSGRDVAFTMIAGEFVYRDGVYPTIDLAEVLGFVQQETVPRVASALGLEAASVLPSVPTGASEEM
jgi:5-methylthioadenosine/S-adenosylhomocysteine deaminase